MKNFCALLTAGAGAVVLQGTAWAQDGAAAQPGTQTSAPQGEGPASVDTVVVTGSRLVRDGFESPSPVTVLGAETLSQTNPQNIADGLRQLPQLLGTRFNGAGDAGSSSAVTVNAAVGAYLDLRRLGPVRTLVLQDGLRVPPNRADGVVDANLLPQLLVDRVEVVTGGASAVYGSDAVAGVVNFVTNTDFTGVKSLLQAGASERGDYENYRVGIAGGTPLFGDRGHVVASVEHYRNDGLPSNCDRPLGCEMWSGGGVNGAAGLGTAANPIVSYPFAGRTALAFGGRIAAGPPGLLGMQFDSQGRLAPFDSGFNIGGGFCIECDGSNNIPSRITLVPKVETTQAFVHTKLDLSDSVEAWFQGSYGSVSSAQNATAEAQQGTIPIFSGNAFLPADAQAILTAAGPNSSFRLGRQWSNMPNVFHEAVLSSLNFAAGLKGDWSDRWQWSVAATHGTSDTEVNGKENESARLFAAIDAVRDPATGQIVCRIQLTHPGVQPNCVPLNPFGTDTASPAALRYVRGAYTFSQETVQKTVNLDLSGELFSSWAGPVSASIGAEYRELDLDAVGNQDNNNTTGVRFGTASSLKYVANNIFPTSGSYDVRELYGEVLLPLLRDIPFSRALDLSGAVRSTDYSTSGRVETWKLGLAWHVSDSVRLRATRSRDIRAPTLNDLFAPFTVQLSGFFDDHTNTNQSVQLISGGNTSLKPEEADTTTVGVVLSPSFIPGFTISVDWYRIDLDDAIAKPFTIQEISLRCEASGGTDPLCASIVRPLPFSDRSPANAATQVIVRDINVSRQLRSGFDIEAAYDRPLLDGDLALRFIASRQSENQTRVAPGSLTDEFAGFNFPKLAGELSATYERNRWTVTLRERYVGSRRLDRTQAFVEPVVKEVFYTDLNVTRDFRIGGGTVEGFLNIANVFDKLPPLVPSQWIVGLKYPSDLTMFDIVGRQFVLGARYNF